MGSIGNPKTWVPFMNTKDCSKGVCSLYCRQWCPSIFPPPPPVEFSVEVSGPNFSPLVIAIIGILASAFLLVSYYAIISKYCGNVDSTRRRGNEDTGEVMEMEDNQTPFAREPWQNSTTGFDEAWQTATTTAGLDEALIKSITVCKYRKGDGLIEGTECSVCLSEFQEDENLRLLPKCSHAFHVHCIDTWLRSHSNCPLCRANIIFISASPLPLPSPVMTESPPPGNDQPSQDRPPVRNENVAAPLPLEVGRVQSDVGGLPKIPSRALSDLGNVQGREIVIEIRGEEEEDYQQMRRSVSMDHLCRNQLSVSDILHMNEEEHLSSGIAGAGPSKQSAEGSKMGNKVRVLHCVMNPAAVRRSISSGRFFLTRQERE